MSNLVPERRMNKNGVWSTKHVRADNASRRHGVLIPKMMSPSVKDRHSYLARSAAQSLIMSDLNDSYTFKPVDGKDFGEECLNRFMSFSDDTLMLLIHYGRTAEREGDAVFAYSSIYLLVAAQATEADFVNTLHMDEYLNEDHDITDPDYNVATCLPLKLYDQHIEQHAGNPTTITERLPYYRALVASTIALETVLYSDDYDAMSKKHDDDGRVPPILYRELAPNISDIPNSPVIEDQRILSLLVQNLDRNDEINKLIMERMELNAESIEAFLYDHHRAVSAGSL